MPLSRPRFETSRQATKRFSVLLAADAVVYKGGLVALNSNGFAVPATESNTLVMAGIAQDNEDNTGGGDGEKRIELWSDEAFKLKNADGNETLTQADLFQACYALDDETVTKTDGGGTRSHAGYVHGLEPDGVWVWIRPDAVNKP